MPFFGFAGFTYELEITSVSPCFAFVLGVQYDHLPHPGPLPRSFIPPLIIAGFTKPWLWLADAVIGKGRNPLVDQVVGEYLSVS